MYACFVARTVAHMRPEARREQGPAFAVFEDGTDAREALRDILESFGHEVEVAQDGFESVSHLLKMAPDVALVDIRLPGIDGYEVARRTRAAPGGDEVCLVALTGYGGPAAKLAAERAGFDAYLIKPVDLLELAKLLVSLPARRNERPSTPVQL